MKDWKDTCRVAVVQAAPVLFDAAACVKKAVRLIWEAAQRSADLFFTKDAYPRDLTAFSRAEIERLPEVVCRRFPIG